MSINPLLLLSSSGCHSSLLKIAQLHLYEALPAIRFHHPFLYAGSRCTVGVVNLKVVAVHFPSQQFENGLQCH